VPTYVTEAQVAELFTPAAAIEAVEASFHRLARGVVDNPSRVWAELPDGLFAVMPCVDHELGFAGHKSFLWSPTATPFLVVLFSIEHARVEAIVEADLLGRLRTAAASAVAAKYLARAEPRTLGVFGRGRQASSHTAALQALFPSLEEVRVAGRNASSEEARAAGECDIVVTATTAKDPVLRGEWLRDGAFVCSVGANDLESRELDNVVLERATFVCTDSRDQAKLEAGDLAEPVASGVLDWLEVHELQDVVTGELRGRVDDADITVFKSNGLAAWDLAAAARVVELLNG
jgi:ornithine cyclodeaminase/alanine dehydrogenase-like protein (mu-crystallin family)